MALAWPGMSKVVDRQMCMYAVFDILWESAREIKEYFADHELWTHGLVDPNVPCPWTNKMG